MEIRTAFYWLNRAEVARAMAEEIHDPFAKQTIMEIAALYEKLAGHTRTVERHSELSAKQPSAARM
jgi:uncharacterized protein YjaZ